MRKIATTIRCVPRLGVANAEVRTIDLDLPPDVEAEPLRELLNHYFAAIGIADAVYDIAVDDDGYYAVINDEAYDARWGTPLL